jgi:hypothetical protein
MLLNKSTITNLLATNDRAVARALVVLNNNQTADEQVQETVKYQNGKGFRPCHARMGTSMAVFFEKRGYLTPKQVAYWRKLDAKGNMRIAIYWNQLIDAANEKAAPAKNVPTGSYAHAAAAANGMVRVNGEFEYAPKATVGDVGNLCEEKLAIEEQLDAYNEGAMGEGHYQDMCMERLHDRLMQINEQLEEINRCEYKMSRDM